MKRTALLPKKKEKKKTENKRKERFEQEAALTNMIEDTLHGSVNHFFGSVVILVMGGSGYMAVPVLRIANFALGGESSERRKEEESDAVFWLPSFNGRLR